MTNSNGCDDCLPYGTCETCGRNADAGSITVTLSPREVQTIQAALDLWTYWRHPLVNHHPQTRQMIAERLSLFAPEPLTDDECQEVSDRLCGLTYDGPPVVLMGIAMNALP